MSRVHRILFLLAAGTIAFGASAARVPLDVELDQAVAEIPEDELLDVGIVVFEPGLPEHDETAREDDGVFSEVRKSEARYLPYLLRNTLQSTGFWGAVRVLPQPSPNVDLLIHGTILESDGRNLAVRVHVADATGRRWFERRYKARADSVAYLEEVVAPGASDPYTHLYVEIANDLASARDRRSSRQLRRVRTVSQLRFAASLAPDAYGDHLELDRRGHYQVRRLPAHGDPMMERIERIRERDYLFVDTLDEHYADLHARMAEPYQQWRSFSYGERQAMRELKREGWLLKVLGGVLLVGAAVADSDSDLEDGAREAAAIGGAVALQAGISKGREAKIHVEALRELAASFDADIAPVLVDVEGRTLRLSGSAETQYATWRKLLADLFATEVGLPVDGSPTQTAMAP